jgi:hypothetical protein
LISQNAVSTAIEIMRNFDAAQDGPWFMIYKELDAAFPGSKFILTTRHSLDWYRSCLSHFAGTTSEVRKWLYGSNHDDPSGHKEHWIKVKEMHEADVRAYFSSRACSFLEMDITAGDNWDKLAPFLGLNKQGPFPKVNTALQRDLHKLSVLYRDASGFAKLYYRVRMRLLRQFGS